MAAKSPVILPKANEKITKKPGPGVSKEASKPNPDSAPDPLTTEDRVRERAHELYLERGGAHGRALDDWLQAEQEVRRKEEEAYLARAEGEGYLAPK